MNIALIIIYIMSGLGLLVAAHEHGKPRSKHNFWNSLLSMIITLTLVWWAVGWKFI